MIAAVQTLSLATATKIIVSMGANDIGTVKNIVLAVGDSVEFQNNTGYSIGTTLEFKSPSDTKFDGFTGGGTNTAFYTYIADINDNGKNYYLTTASFSGFAVHGSITINALGLKDFLSMQMFRIFPSPAVDQITVSGNENIQRVDLFDVSGQLVKAVDLSGEFANVVSVPFDLSPGVYFVNVKTQNKTERQKIVVQ